MEKLLSFKGLGLLLVLKVTGPYAISFMFKMYSQLIIRYPLDNLMLTDCKLKRLILDKTWIKRKFSRIKPVIEA